MLLQAAADSGSGGGGGAGRAPAHAKMVHAVLTALATRGSTASTADYVARATALVQALSARGIVIDDHLSDAVLRIGALHGRPEQVVAAVSALTAAGAPPSLHTMTSVLAALLKAPTPDATAAARSMALGMLSAAGWRPVPYATAAATLTAHPPPLPALASLPPHPPPSSPTVWLPSRLLAVLETTTHHPAAGDTRIVAPLSVPALLPSTAPRLALDACALAAVVRALAASGDAAGVRVAAAEVVASMTGAADGAGDHYYRADVVSQVAGAVARVAGAEAALEYVGAALAPAWDAVSSNSSSHTPPPPSRVLAMRGHLYVQVMQLAAAAAATGRAPHALAVARAAHTVALEQARAERGAGGKAHDLSGLDAGRMWFSDRCFDALLAALQSPVPLLLARRGAPAAAGAALAAGGRAAPSPRAATPHPSSAALGVLVDDAVEAMRAMREFRVAPSVSTLRALVSVVAAHGVVAAADSTPPGTAGNPAQLLGAACAAAAPLASLMARGAHPHRVPQFRRAMLRTLQAYDHLRAIAGSAAAATPAVAVQAATGTPAAAWLAAYQATIREAAGTADDAAAAVAAELAGGSSHADARGRHAAARNLAAAFDARASHALA